MSGQFFSVAAYAALTGLSTYALGSAVTWCQDRFNSDRGYRSGNAVPGLTGGGSLSNVELGLYLVAVGSAIVAVGSFAGGGMLKLFSL
jgi:hypothetical protein